MCYSFLRRFIWTSTGLPKNCRTASAKLRTFRRGQRVTSKKPEATYESREKYASDLPKLPAIGKGDRVIGRDEETRRVLQVLSRRPKNTPFLMGGPGVEKRGMVEGLARR